VLAELWGDLLGVSDVGVQDDFFELGGDSILGAKAAWPASRTSFESTSSPRIVFDAPHGRRHRRTAPPQARRGRDRIRRRRGRAGCRSPRPAATVADERPDGGDTEYNSGIGLRLRGNRSTSEPSKGAETPWPGGTKSLRTTFDTVDGEVVQVIADGGALPCDESTTSRRSWTGRSTCARAR